MEPDVPDSLEEAYRDSRLPPVPPRVVLPEGALDCCDVLDVVKEAFHESGLHPDFSTRAMQPLLTVSWLLAEERRAHLLARRRVRGLALSSAFLALTLAAVSLRLLGRS